MKWDDFLVAIIELVLLKFGSAPDNLATLADAVDGLVLAYCHQRPIQLSASDSDAYMKPEVMEALLEHDKLLRDLFWYYSAPDEFLNSRLMSQEQVGGSTVCGTVWMSVLCVNECAVGGFTVWDTVWDADLVV